MYVGKINSVSRGEHVQYLLYFFLVDLFLHKLSLSCNPWTLHVEPQTF